ncbi:MAG: RNA polymerase sigma factor [Clostridium sp.]|nr:RNA polymerase sigma factor [Clostridium sp.]
MISELYKQKLLEIQTNLYNFAYSLTMDREDASDLLQDTTLKVLSNEDKYVAGTNFRSWAFTIMKNLFINNYRRERRSNVVVDHSDDLYQLNVPVEHDDTAPDDTVAVKEIMAVINSYDPGYRIPMSMYLAGYKYQEIADRMHLPLGTVKSRIFFARRRLRDRFDDYREDM